MIVGQLVAWEDLEVFHGAGAHSGRLRPIELRERPELAGPP